MCQRLKLEVDISADLEAEDFKAELEELEKKVHELLSANPDLRWEMTKSNY